MGQAEQNAVNPLGLQGMAQYFSSIIEAKDSYTQGHSHHVKVVTEAIYNCLPPELNQQLNKDKLLTAALLHDVGKIMIPDLILNKDEGLDEQEWKIVEQHARQGQELLEYTPFADIGEWIKYHHERIDGKGYYKLVGAEIPLETRIISLADTFSALRTYRSYRPAKSIGETMRIMREAAGTQLDGQLLEYFFSLDTTVLENLECNCEVCRQRKKSLEEQVMARKGGLPQH